MPAPRLAFILPFLLGTLAVTSCSSKPAAPAASDGASATAKPAPDGTAAPPAAMPAHSTEPAPAPSMPTGAGGAAAAAPASSAPVSTATGKVVETMDVAGGTYLRLDTGAEKIWVATNKTEAKVGDRFVVPLGMPMRDFHSGALDRDFPLIYFASKVTREGQAPARAAVGAGQAAPVARAMPAGQAAQADAARPAGQAMAAGQGMPAGHPPVPGAPGMPAGQAMPPAHPPIESAAMNVTEVIPPPAGGLSIADIWTRRATLAGKTVIARGKVVKFRGGIMGQNWIHLQDGTGSAKDGTNDLTVTTAADAKSGDVLTVTGTLAVDKDFGAGYRYGAIIEGATLSK